MDSATDQKMDARLTMTAWWDLNVSRENVRKIIFVRRILIAQMTIFATQEFVEQRIAGNNAIFLFLVTKSWVV